MDSWENLRSKMEKALELFNLEEALTYLDVLISSSSPHPKVASLLRNHTLKALPTLHYLGGFPFLEEDLPHLERLIRIFIDFGYDINKILLSGVQWIESPGITALLASVKKQNVILVECLLRCGARGDICDPEGLSPCHWAIKKCNLKCLQVLLEHGGSSFVTAASNNYDMLPLLHEAVDNGHLEIVRYLLRKEEFGVHVDEEASYSFSNGFCYESCKALHIALDKETTPIIQVLMNHPEIKSSRFEELHTLLIDGLPKQALRLLEYFSDEELSTDKIGDRWALHSIGRSAFVDKRAVEYTKKLILEYVRRGWDPNSVSSEPKYVKFDDDGGWEILEIKMTKYNLLHLACIYEGEEEREEIIKFLVEDLGVDMDGKLEGEEKMELTPLMILLNSCQYVQAEYLIAKGADLNVRGNLGRLVRSPERLMRRNLTTGELEQDSSVNTVEMLIRMGDDRDIPLFDQLLARPDVVWHGANEFHWAVEEANPVCAAKVLKRCAEMISKEDINWVNVFVDHWQEPKKVPCLVWILRWQDGSVLKNMLALSKLVKLMVKLGYDLNSPRDPLQSFYGTWDPLIFYIMGKDPEHRNSYLLRTTLQFDDVQLNVTDVEGRNPVEYLLYFWDESCSISRRKSMCWKSRELQHPPILKTVKLLLTHGLDVSGMVIGPNFKYHKGFNLIIKELYSAGAKISEEFFNLPRLCPRRTDESGAIAREIEELKEDFDRETRLTLKHICGLRVRKMLKCVGDLKMLDELPRGLKEAVLEPTVLREVDEEERSDELE